MGRFCLNGDGTGNALQYCNRSMRSSRCRGERADTSVPSLSSAFAFIDSSFVLLLLHMMCTLAGRARRRCCGGLAAVTGDSGGGRAGRNILGRRPLAAAEVGSGGRGVSPIWRLARRRRRVTAPTQRAGSSNQTAPCVPLRRDRRTNRARRVMQRFAEEGPIARPSRRAGGHRGPCAPRVDAAVDSGVEGRGVMWSSCSGRRRGQPRRGPSPFMERASSQSGRRCFDFRSYCTHRLACSLHTTRRRMPQGSALSGLGPQHHPASASRRRSGSRQQRAGGVVVVAGGGLGSRSSSGRGGSGQAAAGSMVKVRAIQAVGVGRCVCGGRVQIVRVGWMIGRVGDVCSGLDLT